MPKQGPNVVVIGAGIIGAATAFYLAKAGLNVTIIDESLPENPATPASFGWINSHNPHNADYFLLRMKSMGLWHGLGKEYSNLPVSFPGSIDWDMDSSSIESTYNKYRSLGYECELVDRNQISRLCPNLGSPPELAIHNLHEGVADPQAIAQAFAKLAKVHGAKFVCNAKVKTIKPVAGNNWSVGSTEDTFLANRLLICAGIFTSGLLKKIDIQLPTDNKPGLLISTIPLDVRIEKIVSSPDFHFWQKNDGSLLAGRNQAGEMGTNGKEAILDSISKKLSEFVPKGDKLQVTNVIEGTRPVPSDGFPVIGQVPTRTNLFVAMMHSGVTLAPLVGSSLASEIATGYVNKNLKQFNISRFDQNAQISAPDANDQVPA